MRTTRPSRTRLVPAAHTLLTMLACVVCSLPVTGGLDAQPRPRRAAPRPAPRPAAEPALTALAVPAGQVVTKVVGDGHFLMLLADGSVRGWGRSDRGQLGQLPLQYADGQRAPGPVTIALPGKAIDIAAGGATSYALLDDHTVVGWGAADKGQLGLGDNAPRPGGTAADPSTGMPKRIPGLEDVVQIVASGGMAAALRRDGRVYAWGSRDFGMIGDRKDPGRYGESAAPAMGIVEVPDVRDIAQLSAGSGHVLALRRDGHVIAWGSNWYGALGREPRRELPMDWAEEVQGISDVVSVVGGNGISTALRRDGTVWVWGANWHAQFGNGDRTDPPGVGYGTVLTPVQVPGVINVAAISLGLTGRHTIALKRDGTLVGWGNTDWGQIGAGVSEMFQERPVTPRLTQVRAVWAVGNNTFAVRKDGTFWGWGLGRRGEWPFTKNTKLPTPVTY
jgi:alpha-tubulin suppressor-like RCC1 family protein